MVRYGRWCRYLVMPGMVVALLGCADPSAEQRLSGDYFGQTPPDLIPELFAGDIVSTGHHEHSTAIYSPDMQHLFYTIADNGQHVILYRHRSEEFWSETVVAPFSGIDSDDRPVFTPDGQRVYFESKRPLTGVPDSAAWRWWFTNLTDTGWSTAQLDSTISGLELSSLMFTANNDIYFSAVYDQGYGNADIYVARFADGQYGEPENLGTAINSAGLEDGPYVAPDGSYLLFSAFGRPEGAGLYVSFPDNEGNWLPAVHLDETINAEGDERFVTVTPDGKYLLFNSQRSGHPVPSPSAVKMQELDARLNQPRGSANLGDVYWVDVRVLAAYR